jgi:hypothetical protein
MGRGHDLLGILFWYLPGRTEETHENPVEMTCTLAHIETEIPLVLLLQVANDYNTVKFAYNRIQSDISVFLFKLVYIYYKCSELRSTTHFITYVYVI